VIKTLRYYYWLVIEFFKKNSKLIILAFFISLIFSLTLTTVYPYFESLVIIKKKIVGLVNNSYSLSDLPDEINYQVSNGLISVDETGRVIPLLAKDWRIEDNGKRFIFRLKPNLIWNDGVKVSTKEFKYNFKGVKTYTPDDQTIIFELASPLPIFINYLKKPIIKYPLVGIGGSYYLGKTVKKNERIKEINLLPIKKNLPPLCYRFYRSDDEMIAAYKKGEVREMVSDKRALIEPLLRWMNTEVIKDTDYKRLYTLFFNLEKPFLKDRDNRISLRMAVDLNKVNQYGQIALVSIPPISWAYNTDLKPWSYEPEMAKKIITKDDSKKEIKLTLYSYFEYAEIVSLISDWLEKIGLKVNVRYISDSMPPPDFDLFLVALNIPDDPDQYFFWHSSQKQTNIAHYVNLKIDKLLEDGRQKTFFANERREFYLSFQKNLYDDPPAIFLFYPYSYLVRRK